MEQYDRSDGTSSHLHRSWCSRWDDNPRLLVAMENVASRILMPMRRVTMTQAKRAGLVACASIIVYLLLWELTSDRAVAYGGAIAIVLVLGISREIRRSGTEDEKE